VFSKTGHHSLIAEPATRGHLSSLSQSVIPSPSVSVHSIHIFSSSTVTVVVA